VCLLSSINRRIIAQELLEKEELAITKIVVEVKDGNSSNYHEVQEDGGVLNASENKDTLTENPPSQLTNKDTHKPQYKHVWLKWLHGFLMFYSYVMILGAAGAFGSNARSRGYPYKKKSTDQLYGRCFGRNLNASAPGYEVTSWLGNLQCGTGPWCTESATGGLNVYRFNEGGPPTSDDKDDSTK